MIRTVALLALIASASAIWPFDSEPKPWNKGFSQIFSINPLAFAKTLPQTLTDATKAKWVTVQGPAIPESYADLTLVVNPSEPTTGLYYDGDNVAGLLIATPVDKITPYYDVTEQGLTSWKNNINGETYLTSRILFVSEDKSSRVYDKKEVIQADNVVFGSINGITDYVPKNLTKIEQDAATVWIKQSCVPFMGRHYYHSMTSATTCDKPFVPYFGLYDEKTKQLIGVGFMVLGKCEGDTYEHPTEKDVKMIVSNGPQCLYDLVAKYGVCTRHIYFVDHPQMIMC